MSLKDEIFRMVESERARIKEQDEPSPFLELMRQRMQRLTPLLREISSLNGETFKLCLYEYSAILCLGAYTRDSHEECDDYVVWTITATPVEDSAFKVEEEHVFATYDFYEYTFVTEKETFDFLKKAIASSIAEYKLCPDGSP